MMKVGWIKTRYGLKFLTCRLLTYSHSYNTMNNWNQFSQYRFLFTTKFKTLYNNTIWFWRWCWCWLCWCLGGAVMGMIMMMLMLMDKNISKVIFCVSHAVFMIDSRGYWQKTKNHSIDFLVIFSTCSSSSYFLSLSFYYLAFLFGVCVSHFGTCSSIFIIYHSILKKINKFSVYYIFRVKLNFLSYFIQKHRR